jgi:hypothetical protein
MLIEHDAEELNPLESTPDMWLKAQQTKPDEKPVE